MGPEPSRAALVVGPERRLVLVHADFFEDHLFFGLEILLAERGAKDVAQQGDGPVLAFRQDGGVEDRVFLVGEGVVVGPHFVEFAVDLIGGAAGRALEHHVFEEVAHAGDFAVSSRAPVRTKNPKAVECASSLHSATISRPLFRTRLRNSRGISRSAAAERYDGEIPRRMLGQIVLDVRTSQFVDPLAHLFQRPRLAEVMPIAGQAPPLRAALDSCCMIRPLLIRAFSRSQLLLATPLASRTNSPRVTSSVSWARSVLVPA